MTEFLMRWLKRAGMPGSACGLIALSLAIDTLAGADVVVLEPAKDNTLFSTTVTSNGAGDSIFSGRTGPSGSNTIQRAVLAFDVAAAVPAGSTIVTASLTLTLVQVSPLGGPETHTLHRILADWGEGASVGFSGTGAPAQANDATWLHTFYPDQFWTNTGGDFDIVASGSQTVTTILGPYTWASPAMAADVQAWLDTPLSSFGWLVMGNEDGSRTSKKFASRESPDVPARPALTIEYLPPAGACPWDCGDPPDGEVGTVDFLALLAQWGQVGGSCDFSGDGVNVNDFLEMLANWGPCPD